MGEERAYEAHPAIFQAKEKQLPVKRQDFGWFSGDYLRWSGSHILQQKGMMRVGRDSNEYLVVLAPTRVPRCGEDHPCT